MNWHKFIPAIKHSSFVFLISLLGFCQFAFAQNKSQIEILGADDLRGTKINGEDVQKLIGNARFKHQEALMFCDSAYFYRKKNSIEAFGNVRINQGDTLNLYGDF